MRKPMLKPAFFSSLLMVLAAPAWASLESPTPQAVVPVQRKVIDLSKIQLSAPKTAVKTAKKGSKKDGTPKPVLAKAKEVKEKAHKPRPAGSTTKPAAAPKGDLEGTPPAKRKGAALDEKPQPVWLKPAAKPAVPPPPPPSYAKAVHQARQAYEKTDYAQAEKIYESIPEQAQEYLRTREELAWTYLRREEWSKLRGLLPSSELETGAAALEA